MSFSSSSYQRFSTQSLAMTAPPAAGSSRRSSFSQNQSGGSAYSTTPGSHSDAFPSSASDYSSSSYSFPPFSSCASPSSSLSSSPALKAVPSAAFSPLIDHLSLNDDHAPSARDVSAYAASIIRNEAYALLALASRLAPGGMSVVSDDFSAINSADRQTRSPSLDGDDSDEAASDEQHQYAYTQQQQSRTNLAFSQVIRNLSSLPPHGKILVTGVGKSGIAGKKMVATFTSLGIPAVFLHPLEALHGDLGVICPCSPHAPCDALLMISHSGATAELMRLLPIVRPRVKHLVAVTRDPDSVLARACGDWLDAGTGSFGTKGGEKETDEADSALPAPTSSVVCALAVGDAVGLSLSRLRIGWSKGGKERRSEFLRCHPGGQLGIELGREGRGVTEPLSPAAPV